ncbi:MAG: hypothetical protein AAGG07_08900 [Planctomycetota bacterium]
MDQVSKPSDQNDLESVAGFAERFEPHLSQGGMDHGFMIPVQVAFIGHAFIAIGVGWVLLIPMLGRVTWLPPELRYALLSVLTLGVLWVYGKACLKGYRRGTDTGGLPLKPDRSHRVRVGLWADQIEPVKQIEDTPFEPEVFRVWMADELPGPIRRLLKKAPGLRVLTVLFCVFTMLLLISADRVGPIPGGVMAATAVIVALYLHRKPAYLRIVPGRVEIMRYPLFRTGAPTIRVLDLRSGGVFVDLRGGSIYVEDVEPRIGLFPPPNKGGATPRPGHRVGFMMHAESDKIGLALLRAARSSAEPGPVEPGRLVG